ncbi:MAG: DUF4062 domain-containing protein, partial [Eggerthellaceae bacterium]|nr:DUF4062 domain-containing protein [Eggerthellaceae bacterium]
MQTWENVYVFISSTFNDMHAERDYLVKRVFPELSEWCEERRLRLVDIDLRWGVTEKDSQENKRVVDVCLKNIDRCRPFFLCFLGQRRGWVPSAQDIAESTFDSFPKLEGYLGSSVTEMEITHALIDPMLNGSVMELKNRERAFFFLRDPGYLDSITDQHVRNVYTNEGEPDPAFTDTKLAEFREHVRTLGRPVAEYAATWNETATTPELLAPGKPESIERGRLVDFRCNGCELADVIIGQMKAALSEMYPDRVVEGAASPLQHEFDEQARFLQFAQEGFIERAGDFDDVMDYLHGDDMRPCVIVAPAGMGKTSYLARLVNRLQDEEACNVLYRFVGTSESSVSQASLLMSIADELKSRFGIQGVPSVPQKIKEALPGLLAKAAAEKPLVVLIDAINQLDTGLDDLSWIPAALTQDVKFVYSFKLGEAAGDALCQRLLDEGETRVLQLRGFQDVTDRENLVTQYLSLFLKELDDDNIEAIIGSAGAENPLFLNVLLSELRVFGSHEGLRDKIAQEFGPTPQTAFDGLLRRLESDPLYSHVPMKELVAHVFGWLAHSKNGLEPQELAGLLVNAGLAETIDEARDSVSLLLRQMRMFLAKRDKRQDFFYESFFLAARNRYENPIHGGNPAVVWHAELARYFESVPDESERKAFELVYQHAHAGCNERVVALLTSFGFLERRVKQGGIQGLLEDYALAELPQSGVASDDREQLALVREALEMAAPIVEKSPSQLAGQLFGRLMGFDLPLAQNLLADADRVLAERREPWLKPLCVHLPQPGSRIMRYYNTIADHGACMYRDGRRMVVYSTDDKAAKIVEIESGRVLRSFALRNDPCRICLCEDEGVLAVREMRKLYFLNLATGQTYDAEGVFGMYGTQFAAHDGMIVCAGNEPGASECTAYVSDVMTGALLHSWTYSTGRPEKGFLNTFSVAFDSDTGLMVMSTEDIGFVAYDPHDDFQQVRQFRNTACESADGRFKSSQCSFFDGTPFLVTRTTYDGLTIYDKTTGEALAQRKLYNASGVRITVSPDCLLLAFSSFSSIEIVSLQTFETVSRFDTGNSKNQIQCLSFSRDGDSLLVGRADGVIQVWDFNAWIMIDEYGEAKDRVSELHLNAPDNKMVALH